MITTKRYLLSAVAVTAIVLLAGCGGKKEEPTPTPVPAAVESATSSEVAAAPADSSSTTADTTAAVASTGNASIDAVAGALRNQLAHLPMRVSMSSNGTDQGSMEIASPTAMRLSSNGMQLMIVDGKVYMQENGVWTENTAMAGMASTMTSQFDLSNIQTQIDTIATAEQLPDETINGEAVSVYKFTSNTGDPADAEPSMVYVRKSDNLPVRVSNNVEGEDGYTVDYTYDSSIVIEAPQ